MRLTRSQLVALVEDLETANERLKASNEDVLSKNAALQSTNEVLTAVNCELKSRVDSLSEANNDLRSYFASTDLPLLTVNRDLRIRDFTDATRRVYPLLASDRGRPLNDVPCLLYNQEEIEQRVRAVVETAMPASLTLHDVAGEKTWLLRVIPHRGSDRTIEGAMLVYFDVTEPGRSDQARARSDERLRLALEGAGIGFWEYDASTGRASLDATARTLFGFDADELLTIESILGAVHADDIEAVEETLRRSNSGDIDCEASFRVVTRDGRRRYLKNIGRRLSTCRSARIVGVSIDMTPEFEAQQGRILMLREINHRMKNLFSIVAGMLRIAARDAKSVRQLSEEVVDRITALAKSHDLTQMPLGGEGATRLTDLVGVALAPYRGDVTVSGPDVSVAGGHVAALAMILHEWATNSAKYGVLGALAGHLRVTWHVSEGGQVGLDWAEFYDERQDDGRTPGQERPGFGSTLVQLSAAQLGGETDVEIAPTHRTHRLRFVSDQMAKE
ncbi:PAS domain-containing protein [Defluviimonas sp. WL0024]|uniref:histidine kinase n=1 Tax=Albidovulum salinarum TaxID=2984153 RepID=A0ABT2X927_9RHOB|nr:HWE histidine kinase domain-containing protein [Defluviimonas sp. WL0024]MCU9850249.1 PAS domain-containing protein [Defluviimonas sp. WL0024]